MTATESKRKRCKERVYDSPWGGHRCKRLAVKDGYCAQHYKIHSTLTERYHAALRAERGEG